MEKIWYGSMFSLIAALVIYSMHRYAWVRLVRDARLRGRQRMAATLGLIAGAIFIPVAFLLGRKLEPLVGGAIGWPVWVWFGFLFYAVMFLLGLDVVRLALRTMSAIGASLARRMQSATGSNRSEQVEDSTTPSLDAPDPSRRAFLARTVAGTALIGAGGTTIAGLAVAEGEIASPEVPIALPRLPSALDGFRIAQISDLHTGPLIQRGFVERVVQQTNALKPDLIVITGDLVDGSVKNLARELDALSKLRARHGIAFVTGNHEYYSGPLEWVEWLRARGVRVLLNEHVSIGDAGASFDLAGVTDAHAQRTLPSHASDPERALLGRDPERALVMLAHQPASIAGLEGRGVGLMLAGHTHGGQMWPFGSLVGLVQPYVAGLHRHPDGTKVYVSRGTGFWGPPMRIANPAEITSIVLTRATSAS